MIRQNPFVSLAQVQLAARLAPLWGAARATRLIKETYAGLTAGATVLPFGDNSEVHRALAARVAAARLRRPN
jgi:hypothetical protein